MCLYIDRRLVSRQVVNWKGSAVVQVVGNGLTKTW